MSPEVVLIQGTFYALVNGFDHHEMYDLLPLVVNPAPYIEKEVLFTKAENIPRIFKNRGI